MNKKYWDNFYREFDIKEPTLFAKWIWKFLEREYSKGKTLLELGCGNGRDAIYFAKMGINVKAIDQSRISIKKLQDLNIQRSEFICDDFTKLENLAKGVDFIYSRFTLHSITKEEADDTLKWIYSNLNKNGHLCIEVRSIKDELYGRGTLVERDAYVTDHYRRFVRIEEIEEQLKNLGFKLKYINESNEYAPYGDQKPYVIRIVGEKYND